MTNVYDVDTYNINPKLLEVDLHHNFVPDFSQHYLMLSFLKNEEDSFNINLKVGRFRDHWPHEGRYLFDGEQYDPPGQNCSHYLRCWLIKNYDAIERQIDEIMRSTLPLPPLSIEAIAIETDHKAGRPTVIIANKTFDLEDLIETLDAGEDVIIQNKEMIETLKEIGVLKWEGSQRHLSGAKYNNKRRDALLERLYKLQGES